MLIKACENCKYAHKIIDCRVIKDNSFAIYYRICHLPMKKGFEDEYRIVGKNNVCELYIEKSKE